MVDDKEDMTGVDTVGRGGGRGGGGGRGRGHRHGGGGRRGRGGGGWGPGYVVDSGPVYEEIVLDDDEEALPARRVLRRL